MPRVRTGVCGRLLRRRLRLATYKRHGVYVLPLSEQPKLEVLWEKYGLAIESDAAAKFGDLSGGHGDVGTSAEGQGSPADEASSHLPNGEDKPLVP